MLTAILHLQQILISNIEPVVFASVVAGITGLAASGTGAWFSYVKTKFSLEKDHKVHMAEMKTTFTECQSKLNDTKKDAVIETERTKMFMVNCEKATEKLIQKFDSFEEITNFKLDKVVNNQNIMADTQKTLVKSISSMQLNIENKQDFKKQLLNVQNEGINYYNETKDEKILNFAVYKSNHFIELALNLRELDLNSPKDFEIFLKRTRIGAEEVKQYGYQTVGKEFTNKFYKLHEKEVEIFISAVKEIIDDKINRKKFNYSLECQRFLRKFLSILFRCYCESQLPLPKNRGL